MADKTRDLSNAIFYHHGAFPPARLDYKRLAGPLEEAAASLGRYDAKMAGMGNSALLVAPLRLQDIVTSSGLDGLIATIEKASRLEASADAGGTQPWREVRKDDIEALLYARALRSVQAALPETTPLGEQHILLAHRQLLSFGRGAHRQSGLYRTRQNYIGSGPHTEIHYVPIEPQRLKSAMSALMQFINTATIRPLIRTAIAYAEIQSLHPFDDGNGRIGRMLVTLMLWRLGVLGQPNFFVSRYFKAHIDEYIERIEAVSGEDDWTGWVLFFLKAMDEQARLHIQTTDAIAALHSEMRGRFRAALNSRFHDQLLDFIFKSPVFRNDQLVHGSGIPPASAGALSRRLVDAGLLGVVQPAAGRRAACYAFEPLLDLLQG